MKLGPKSLYVSSKRKMALIRRAIQAGFINGFGRKARRRLLKTLVVLLMFTLQSLAWSICHCNSPIGAQHMTCHEARHSDLMKCPDGDATRPHASRDCSVNEEPVIFGKDEVVTAEQSDQLVQPVPTCCQASSQDDAEVVAVSSESQAPIIIVLPPINLGTQTNLTPAPFRITPQHPARPLYLSFPCLLI